MTFFDENNEYMKIFDFKTSSSVNIKKEVIKYAISNINRCQSIFLLARIVNFNIADNIEKGVLEYTLIMVSNKCPDILSFIDSIYKSKINDIYANLDIHNKNINNQTLYNDIINNQIDPYYLAFMKPEHIHPANWTKELEKKRIIEETNNLQCVSDIYKCYKCGDKRCTTMQLQTRSADEPVTVFVTCLTCHNTFTK